MEVSIVAGVIAAILLIIWLSKRLNEYSIREYGYAPIGMGTILLGMIPYVLIIAGFIFLKEDSNNLFMAIIFASASIIGLFLWISHHASAPVAAAAIVLLMLIGLPMLLLLLASSERDDDYYYYD